MLFGTIRSQWLIHVASEPAVASSAYYPHISSNPLVLTGPIPPELPVSCPYGSEEAVFNGGFAA